MPNDHFAEDTLGRYAGLHIILDMHGCAGLDTALPSTLFNDMALAANATVLRVTHYAFLNGGETALALLAESHISIHTWPEHKYAAADIFMCGKTDAEAAMAVLLERLQPQHTETNVLRRGEGVGA